MGMSHSAEHDTYSSVLVLPNRQHTLKMGIDLVPPQCRKTFTSWRGCLAEKISVHSVAAKA